MNFISDIFILDFNRITCSCHRIINHSLLPGTVTLQAVSTDSICPFAKQKLCSAMNWGN